MACTSSVRSGTNLVLNRSTVSGHRIGDQTHIASWRVTVTKPLLIPGQVEQTQNQNAQIGGTNRVGANTVDTNSGTRVSSDVNPVRLGHPANDGLSRHRAPTDRFQSWVAATAVVSEQV